MKARRVLKSLMVVGCPLLAWSNAHASDPTQFNGISTSFVFYRDFYLDDALRRGGYATVSRPLMEAAFHRNIMFGASNYVGVEWGVALPVAMRKAVQGSFQTDVTSKMQGFFLIGGILPASRRFNLQSQMGLGLGYTRVEVAETGQPGLDDLVASPRRGFSIVAKPYLLKVSLGPDFPIGKSLLGIRLNFETLIGNAGWGDARGKAGNPQPSHDAYGITFLLGRMSE